MEKINAEQICSIEIQKNRICFDYEYRKEKRLFWGLVKMYSAGFYYKFSFEPHRVSEELILALDKKLVIHGYHVFYKPRIIINLSDGTYKILYFETEELLDEYVEKTFSILNLLPTK